jgi:N-acetylneuraminic acid mutarotase
MTIYGEAPGSFGYLCSPASNEMYKFDPAESSWTKLNTNKPFYLVGQMGEVVCKDTFYLISGFDYSRYGSYMYAFNEVLNSWTTIQNIPFMRREGFAFSLNSKIYFGLDYVSGTLTDLWECDPGNGYLWTKKTNFPVTSFKTFSTYFSLGDKGYVVFSDNSFWQYDPISNVWTKKANFPGPARVLAVSFVIEGNAYLGTGRSNLGNYNDIWRYDPVADSWSLISNMPVARNSGVAFVINNKAYIGYGVDMANNQRSDFYEFDPNYSLK